MDLIKSVNLAVRFLLELGVLAAVGYWGFKTWPGWLGKLGFGLGGPLLIAVIWAMFGSPQARFPLQGWRRLGLEVLVFGSGVAALAAANRPDLAWTFGLIYVVNKVLMVVWRQ